MTHKTNRTNNFHYKRKIFTDLPRKKNFLATTAITNLIHGFVAWIHYILKQKGKVYHI